MRDSGSLQEIKFHTSAMQLEMRTGCRWKSTGADYSNLSATMGSTRIARLDGR